MNDNYLMLFLLNFLKMVVKSKTPANNNLQKMKFLSVLTYYLLQK